MEFARQAGFAAGSLEIALMHHAIDGLLLDLLTPSLGVDTPTDEILDAFVTRLVGPATAR